MHEQIHTNKADITTLQSHVHSVEEDFTVTSSSATNPAKINIVSEIGQQADGQSLLEFVVDRSNNGYDHKASLEMTEHGNLRVMHNRFFSTNPTITEVARFTKNQCLLLGGGKSSSTIDSYDNNTWAPKGFAMIGGKMRLYNADNESEFLMLKNVSTTVPSSAHWVYKDSNGFLKIS